MTHVFLPNSFACYEAPIETKECITEGNPSDLQAGILRMETSAESTWIGQSIKVAQLKRFSSSIFFFVRAVSSGEVVFFLNLNRCKIRYIHSSHGCEF